MCGVFECVPSAASRRGACRVAVIALVAHFCVLLYVLLYNVAQESKRGVVITQFCGNFCVLLYVLLAFVYFSIILLCSRVVTGVHGSSFFVWHMLEKRLPDEMFPGCLCWKSTSRIICLKVVWCKMCLV